MNELTLKLKTEVINRLISNEQNADEPYMFLNNKKYTRRELANEIQSETKEGINLLTNMLILAIDLTARQKI